MSCASSSSLKIKIKIKINKIKINKRKRKMLASKVFHNNVAQSAPHIVGILSLLYSHVL